MKLSNDTKINTSKKKRSLLKAEPINEGLERSYLQPDPRKLFGQFWWENELVICFASTNVGKTLLAMQIAESLATGTQVFDHKENPCLNEAKEMKVLYIDAELTYKQIENRYKNSETGKEIQTPKTPILYEKKKTRGIKKKACLVRVSKRAGSAFPIA